MKQIKMSTSRSSSLKRKRGDGFEGMEDEKRDRIIQREELGFSTLKSFQVLYFLFYL